MAWLEKHTPMRLAHSSGTTGKLSFFPRSSDDIPILTKAVFKSYEGIGAEPKNDLLNSGKDVVYVWLSFRKGNTVLRFLMDGFADLVASETRFICKARVHAKIIDMPEKSTSSESNCSQTRFA